MESPKNLWIWGFLLVGVCLIGLSLYFGAPTPPTPKATQVLAKAEKLTGSAQILHQNMLQKETLVSRADLAPLDSVETGDLGEVQLDFDSGDRVRLKEHSLVTLERVEDQKGFHVVLILKHGDLQIDQLGREGDLYIAKNGERIAATDYGASPLSHEPAQEAAAEPGTAPTAEADQAAPLSEKEIQDVMNAHRTSFLKCYTQLLQKDPRARGDVSLSFTIENTGKMSAIEVTSPTLQQEDFKKCLIDVMTRVEFRAFKGPPVSTLFPLKFE